MPKTVHYCNVCGSAFSRLEDAEYCEVAGDAAPAFEVGDTVYVDNRATRAVEPRKVVDRVQDGHGWLYGLDMPYEAQNGQLWGVAGPRSGKYAGRCHEGQLSAEMPKETEGE